MKTLFDRLEAATSVVTNSRRWSPSKARELTDFLRPFLAEDEEMPDVELLQELFTRALEHRQKRLKAADDAHDGVDLARRRWLHVRAAATKELIRRIVDLRALLRGFVGAKAAGTFLGFEGETSRDPVVLLRQATVALAALRDPSRSLDLKPYQPFDRAGWASAIDDAAAELRSAAAEVSRKHKEIDGAVHGRQESLDDFDDAFVHLAGWFEATYRIVGDDLHAAAVKPSRQRPGRLIEEVRKSARRSELKRARKAAREQAQALPPSSKAPAAADQAESQAAPLAPLQRVVRFFGGRNSPETGLRVRSG